MDGDAMVEEYLRIGLGLGRHLEGVVDAYYGPPAIAAAEAARPPIAPAALVARCRRLLGDLEGDREMAPARRRWLIGQSGGLLTSARKLHGEDLGYLDEVESSYGVRPQLAAEDDFAAAHRRLGEALPGSGPIGDRLIAWRESHAVPTPLLRPALESLAEDFAERTARMFGLPDGQSISFELVTGQPWSGFNYYLGDLTSRIAINVDLPVLSTSLGHLVAHEAFPGHHTEHCRKEIALVRRLHQLEESIFLVGTPQCLLAEGLADLGLEAIAGRRPEAVVASHLHPLGITYDAELIAQVAEASEVLASVRGNAAVLLHEHGRSVDEVVAYVGRWAMLSQSRAAKAVEFLSDPTWRAYVFCYIDGVRLCRQFVRGDPARFTRLLDEQLLPADLIAA